METIASFFGFNGDTFTVHADGGRAELIHTNPDGIETLVEEGETCTVVDEYLQCVFNEIAPGLVAEACCEDDE